MGLNENDARQGPGQDGARPQVIFLEFSLASRELVYYKDSIYYKYST